MRTGERVRFVQPGGDCGDLIAPLSQHLMEPKGRLERNILKGHVVTEQMVMALS